MIMRHNFITLSLTVRMEPSVAPASVSATSTKCPQEGPDMLSVNFRAAHQTFLMVHKSV